MPNINKNIIKQAGAAVANATNKAAGLSATTPEPGSIISAIQLVNGGREIGPAALAHFTESVRNKLLSLLVTMEPIQDLHGYVTPWPAGGGKNKLPSPTATSKTANGITISVDNGVYTITGTATSTAEIIFDLPFTVNALSGQKTAYLNDAISAGVVMYYRNNYTNGAEMGFGGSANKVSNTYSNGFSANKIRFLISSGTAVGTLHVSPMLIDGAEANPTSFSPYSNICPISGRTGLSVYVGPTSAIGDATTCSMDWTSPAGTVYAGSADIVTGDIKAAPYYASYNGETLVGPWVSSMDEYDPEGTPTIGAQVVDLGGTMTEYHITGQDIITLVGDNYIWSDSGDVIITE